MFKSIRNNIFGNSVALIIKNYLDIQEKNGLLDHPEISGIPSESHSLMMVSEFKKLAPSLFSNPKHRPNKVALATAVLAYGAESASDSYPMLRNAFLLSLGNILTEINVHHESLKLSEFDLHLIEKATSKYTELDSKFTAAQEDEETQISWNAWLQRFKNECAQINPELAKTDSGAIIDFMDLAPLKQAWEDNVSPEHVAKGFAHQFDIRSFGKK
jgi:hypothetical protein